MGMGQINLICPAPRQQFPPWIFTKRRCNPVIGLTINVAYSSYPRIVDVLDKYRLFLA
jgi:hypothetical protein